jgi:hypothetical protein
MNYLRIGFVFYILTLMSAQCLAQLFEKSDTVIGGTCLYKIYPGRATIVSINSWKDVTTKERGRFEVKFSFEPHGKIQEDFAQVDGKTFLLYDQHLHNPDIAFINKYHIQVGQILVCNIEVISRGTCTPVIFNFPTLK